MALAVQSGNSSRLGLPSAELLPAKSASAPLKRHTKSCSALQTKASSFFGRTQPFRQELLGRKYRRARQSVRAEAGNASAAGVSWELKSPTGQFLVTLLQNHPHLFPAAADQQLQQLAEDREATAALKNLTEDKEATAAQKKPTDLVLYKRIAEVKEQERRTAIVEVMYSLVLHKFSAANISMIPKIPDLPPDQQVDTWGFRDEDLESIHSPEVLEVVKEHLGMILGRPNPHYLEAHTLVQASKMKIGHLYAATMVFGYFLRRLDQRYQLDMSMRKALADSEEQSVDKNVLKELEGISPEMDFKTDAEGEKLAAEANAAVAAMAASKGSIGMGMFPQLGWRNSKLKSYVMSDPDSVQRFATLRCQESMFVVEKQTEALFGKPQAELAPDGSVVLLGGDPFTISLSGLRRLVLEAVAFGSFLWEAESHVDSHYNLTSSS